jgi:hypothetical protein
VAYIATLKAIAVAKRHWALLNDTIPIFGLKNLRSLDRAGEGNQTFRVICFMTAGTNVTAPPTWQAGKPGSARVNRERWCYGEVRSVV